MNEHKGVLATTNIHADQMLLGALVEALDFQSGGSGLSSPRKPDNKAVL